MEAGPGKRTGEGPKPHPHDSTLGESSRDPQDPSPLRGTLASSLRSPAEGEGHEGFPPPPEKAWLASAPLWPSLWT